MLCTVVLVAGVMELEHRWASGHWFKYVVASSQLTNAEGFFAVKVINGTLVPQPIEAVVDHSFQGIACQDSLLYRAVLERWEGTGQRWTFVRELNPLDALKQDRIREGSVAHMSLWPGRSLCAGWFPPRYVVPNGTGVRFRVVILQRFSVGRSDPANHAVATVEIGNPNS